MDVRQISEACTSPEIRYIRAMLGDLNGKRLLDVGCGLGEASVYFAMEGAQVTSVDLSHGMLDATNRLAHLHGVNVRTHKSAVESLGLPADERFDVIYAGNLLHHVDIPATIRRLKRHLTKDGVFVSWDPLAYNPLINVYPRFATTSGHRTSIRSRCAIFGYSAGKSQDVQTRYFWLTTLVVFLWMAVGQRRNPNRERFWKAVVKESEQWKPLYNPLSKLDAVLLKLFPPLRLLCWNVVIAARLPN